MTQPWTADGQPRGARLPGAPAAEPRIELCRDPDRFADLAPQWDDLHRRCRAATPFQSHAWLHSWWLSYGEPGRLRLVLVHEAGRLIGAAPLILAFRPLPVLLPLGGGITDFCDVLLDDSRIDTAAAALAWGLRRTARTAVIDLREVRPGGCAERLLDHWRGPRRRLPDSVCLELPGMPLEDLIARLPAAKASQGRRKLRKLDRLGVEHRRVPAAEVPAAIATLLRLHGLQWRDRGITPEHLRRRFADHLTRAATRMVGSGEALVAEYRLGGDVVAAELTLLSRDLAGTYLFGAHPGLRAEVDISTMLLRHNAAYAAETGRRTLCLLRGNESYKRRWQPELAVNRRLLLACGALAPALYLRVAQQAARSRLARAARARLSDPAAWRARWNRWRTRRAGER